MPSPLKPEGADLLRTLTEELHKPGRKSYLSSLGFRYSCTRQCIRSGSRPERLFLSENKGAFVHHSRNQFVRAAAAAAAILLAWAAVPAASAESDTGNTDATAALISSVAPVQGEVVAGDRQGDEVVVSSDEVATTVPLDAAEPVAIESAASQTLPSAMLPPIEVAVPQEARAEIGQMAQDGTIVFSDSSGEAAAAVQTFDDASVRIQTIANSPSDPTVFTYTFGDGIRPVAASDGRIELLADLGSVAAVVGEVDKAWAADASGAEVKTYYRIEGEELVQVIEPTSQASYPIVADPKVTRTWWNTTVYFKRSETFAIASATNGAAVAAALIPEPTLSKAAAVAGGLAGVYIDTIYGADKCLKFVYYGHVANVWQPYSGREAGGYCK